MSYQVSFYREIVNSYGKPFKAPVYTAEIAALGSMDEAIATAIDAFKRDRGLSCWSALADGYEVAYEAKSVPIPITIDRDAVAAADGDGPDGAKAPPEHRAEPRRRPGDGPRDPAAHSAKSRIRMDTGPQGTRV